MRTKTLVLAAALSAASLATSMAQVYSVNAVGYVNVTLKKGYNFVANPLNNGGNTLAEILPPLTAGLPADTYVVTFNPAAGAIGAVDPESPTFYPPDGAGFNGIWDPAGPALPPGKGFFIYIDPTAPQAQYTVTFVGEVPTGTLSNPIVGGGRYNALGSQVPQAGKITTDLGLVPQEEDAALLWDKTATPPRFSPTILTYNGGVWNDGQNAIEPEIGVGDAFYLFRTAASNTPWTRTFNLQ